MGRSVSTPTNAVEVIYLDWYPDPDDLETMIDETIESDDLDLCRHDRQTLGEALVSVEFDYLIEDFVENVLRDLFPSIEPADRWLDREDHVVAENGLVEFGISEYMGLAALWAVPKDGGPYGDDNTEGLARHWLSQAWPKVEERYPNRLYRMGTFSNGESVYQRVEEE